MNGSPERSAYDGEVSSSTPGEAERSAEAAGGGGDVAGASVNLAGAALSDGSGGITHLRTHDGLRPTWYLILPGSFGGAWPTDRLFYER